MENNKNHNRKEAMFALIKTCTEMGISNRAFCEREGISEALFYYWQKKYRGTLEKYEDKFIPVRIDKSLDCIHEIEICYPNGVRVKLPQGFDLSKARSFISLF